jgi:hypothetical protein
MAIRPANDIDAILIASHHALLSLYADDHFLALKILEAVWPQVVRTALYESRAAWSSPFFMNVLLEAQVCQSFRLTAYVPLQYKLPHDIAVLYETIAGVISHLRENTFGKGMLHQFHHLMPVLTQIALANTLEPYGSDYHRWLGELESICRAMQANRLPVPNNHQPFRMLSAVEG